MCQDRLVSRHDMCTTCMAYKLHVDPPGQKMPAGSLEPGGGRPKPAISAIRDVSSRSSRVKTGPTCHSRQKVAFKHHTATQNAHVGRHLKRGNCSVEQSSKGITKHSIRISA